MRKDHVSYSRKLGIPLRHGFRDREHVDFLFADVAGEYRRVVSSQKPTRYLMWTGHNARATSLVYWHETIFWKIGA